MGSALRQTAPSMELGREPLPEADAQPRRRQGRADRGGRAAQGAADARAFRFPRAELRHADAPPVALEVQGPRVRRTVLDESCSGSS